MPNSILFYPTVLPLPSLSTSSSSTSPQVRAPASFAFPWYWNDSPLLFNTLTQPYYWFHHYSAIPYMPKETL